MPGNKMKLTPSLQQQIVNTLASGTTTKKMCDLVGISQSTFYRWLETGRAYAQRESHDFMPYLVKDRKALKELSESVTRAKASAHVKAASVIRDALDEQLSQTDVTETITEVRLRKVKDKNGKIVEEPYEYVKTTRRQSETSSPPDWRAAVEFLKRRDSKAWSEKLNIDIDITRIEEVIAAIRKLGHDESEIFNEMIRRAAEVEQDANS